MSKAKDSSPRVPSPRAKCCSRGCVHRHTSTEALDQGRRGELCGQCFLPSRRRRCNWRLRTAPVASTGTCTSSCHKAAMATHHGVLCTGIRRRGELMGLVEEHKWQSLHSVARSVARLLSTLTLITRCFSKPEGGRRRRTCSRRFETGFLATLSFATVSELERRSRNRDGLPKIHL